MKKFILFSALIAFTQAASASQIISTWIWKQADGTTQTQTYSGFSEDGFNLATKTCYLESALGVCALIEEARGAQDHEYGSGGHGTFEVKSCSIEGKTVKLSYDRINDYDGRYGMELDINPCSDKE